MFVIYFNLDPLTVIFGLYSGPAVSEQPRPSEEMNGVLNDEELPPQVIKRCEKRYNFSVTMVAPTVQCN